jgi:hypothetical protein
LNRPDAAQSVSIICTGKQGPMPDLSGLTPCGACHFPILPGQYFTTVPVGCGADPEQRALARQRLPFRVLTVAVHWACFQGDESESHLSIV